MKQVILQPVLSEKSLAGADRGKYIFVVARDANKPQISRSIKDIYKVDAIKVNVISVQSEDKMVRGRYMAHTPRSKKAVVTLKKGQKIEGFEFKD